MLGNLAQAPSRAGFTGGVRMAQRRVLITGAGSGLGQALAHRYARAGDKVACVDLDAARDTDTLAAHLGALPESA